jgi:predicted DNA-binding transcriptional regulator
MGERPPRKKDNLLRCYACNEYKPASKFYRNRSDKYGHSKICRKCQTPRFRDYLKRYYQEHRDILLPKHRLSALASRYKHRVKKGEVPPKPRHHRLIQVLEVLSRMTDGARPVELAKELGITSVYAAVLLSRYRSRGIVVKRLGDDGWPRYCSSSKGRQMKALLEERRTFREKIERQIAACLQQEGLGDKVD